MGKTTLLKGIITQDLRAVLQFGPRMYRYGEAYPDMRADISSWGREK